MTNVASTRTGTRDPNALSHRALAALVGQLIGDYPNPEEPHPPGPFDMYIRAALRDTRLSLAESPLLRLIAERHPEIWEVIGGGPIVRAALNPQPLPPRAAFAVAFARAVVERMTLVQEVADLLPNSGGERGIIIVGGHIAALTDELCGTGLRLKWPFPGPRPRWFAETVNGVDLLVIGLQFHHAVAESLNRALGQEFADAANQLIETGAGRL